MSVKVENLEHNMAKLTIEVEAERLDKALTQAYNRQKKSISIPGFRKGKVPRVMVEKMYGPEVFFEDGANILMQEAYPEAYDECGLDIVSRPDVEVVQIEKDKPFIFTATVAVKPAVTLGKYKGVTVTKIDMTVSDQDVDEEIEKERLSNARTAEVERPIASGDTANIDFEGFVDDVPFEGGKGEKYDLEIGSHSFIDTFEDQLIGKKKGDKVDVKVTFPKDYQAADLAGKKALFKVTVNTVSAKELPELDDEFAQDVSEFDTLAEYKADVKKKLEDSKEKEARRTKEDEAIAKIIDKSEMDIPEAMIAGQMDNMINNMGNRMAQQGLSIQQYMQMTGTSMEQLREQIRPEAEDNIKSSLVLEAIAKEENLEVTEEDIDSEIEKMAASYGMKAEELKGYVKDDEKENLRRDLLIQKAADFVMDNAKERAKAKKKTTAKKDAEEESTEE